MNCWMALSIGSLAGTLLGGAALEFWGMDDQFCPPSGAPKVAGQCPKAQVILLSRCGHWVMVEHPEVFNTAVANFLDTHQGT